MLARRRVLALAPILAFAVLALPAHAADDPAIALAKRALARDPLGVEGAHAKVTMKITRDDGSVDTRAFEVWSKKKDGLARTKIRFTAPSSIAGMAFLLLQKKDGGDEQWVYLPAYKKARRVTANEKTTAFASSDFTYADLERRDSTEATYKILPDESIGKDSCAVLDATPKDTKKLGYARVTSWLRKSDDVPLRTQFFGLDGKLEKTLFARKVKTVDGRVLVSEARMERVGGKRATELVMDDVDVKASIPDTTFALSTLESGD
jgi:hypothetical protein